MTDDGCLSREQYKKCVFYLFDYTINKKNPREKKKKTKKTTNMEQQQQQEEQHHQLTSFLINDISFEHRGELERFAPEKQWVSDFLSTIVTSEIFTHQLDAITWMYQKEKVRTMGCRGGLLLDDSGLGKTLTMIALALLPIAGGKHLTTLFVVPAHLISMYKAEIEQHFSKEVMDIHYYYNGKKNKKRINDTLRARGEGGERPTLVFSSYEGVAAEWMPHEKKWKASSPFSHIVFDRIFLDEGHHIRNRSSRASIACCALHGERFWAVTATPIFNRIDDLFPLVSFIGVSEFVGNYNQWNIAIVKTFQRDAEMAKLRLKSILVPLTIRRTKQILDLPMIHEECIKIPFSEREQQFYSSLFQYSQNRVNELLAWIQQYKQNKILWAVSQQQQGHDHQKEPNSRKRKRPTSVIMEGSLSRKEEIDKMRLAHSTLLQIILRLRQSCDSPYLVMNAMSGRFNESLASSSSPSDGKKEALDDTRRVYNSVENAIATLKKMTEEKGDCLLCMDRSAEYVSHPCLHACCKECWIRIGGGGNESAVGERSNHNITCPFCRQSVQWVCNAKEQLEYLTDAFEEHLAEVVAIPKEKKTKGVPNNNNNDEKEWVQSNFLSSKIELLIQEIKKWCPGRKILIVSQWAQFLDLLAKSIQHHTPEFGTIQLDGSKSGTSRYKLIQQYQQDPKIRICLLTMSSISDGVTLTAGSRVYIADQWWNNSKPYQSANRLCRIGQTNEVTIVRLIAQQTIEEAVVKMADQKSVISGVTLSDQGVPESISYINNVRLLFSLKPT